jgi:hypothetical protein
MYQFFANPLAYPTLRQLGGDEGELRHLSGAPERFYGTKKSPGLPLLINGTGLFEYGALHFSYVLDTYDIQYGALHFSYILGGIVDGTVVETASAVEVSAASAIFQSLVGASSGVAAFAATFGRDVDALVLEAGVASDVVTLNQTVYAAVESMLGAVMVPRAQGQDNPVWVVNTGLWAATRFSNYPFNSYAEIDGRFYGASEDGLYELTGETDAGANIDASAMLRRSREQSSQQKRVDRVYLHGTSDKRLEVRVITPTGDVHRYRTEVDLGDEVTVQRVKLGRGLMAQYWMLEVRNYAGGDMTLDQIEIVSLHTTRKIRRER